MRRNAFHLVLQLGFGLITGCGGSGDSTAPVAVRLGLSVEPSATASIGVPFATQPRAQILDAAGTAVTSRGVLVTASVASGPGSLGGTTGVRTDINGTAIFTDLVPEGPVGTRTLRFSAEGLSAAISQSINATAGPVTSALALAGNNQTAPVGTALPVSPAVRVADGSNNPIADVPVTFTVTGGGGSVTGASQVTDAQGIATVGQWTLGTNTGSNTMQAKVEGLALPVVFVATAVVGTATNITLIEGNGQTAMIGIAVPIAPTVKVTDPFGHALQGLAVNFVPAPTSGTVTGNPAITDVDGIARLGSWILGLTPGGQTLNATRQGATPVPFSATAVDYPVTLISAGTGHSCAVGADALARCWGANNQGQLGNGSFLGDSVPVLVNNGADFTQIVTGTLHSCALSAGGQASCWGGNASGQLGDGGTSGHPSPVSVSSTISFTRLTAGSVHTCGVADDGRAYCWGSGGNGRLGTGDTQFRTSPSLVSGGHVFTSLSAGVEHTCGVRTDGMVLCWGNNGNGRLGDGTTTEQLTPVPVASSVVFTAVAAGGLHTCALDINAHAWCWGFNASGQLGNGNFTEQLLPVAVLGGRTFSALTAGTAHTCGLTTDFAVFCWGENSGGRLGNGTTTDRNSPALVLGGVPFTIIRAGDVHSCARSSAGSAICWGGNITAQLGDGSTTNRLAPVGVKKP